MTAQCGFSAPFVQITCEFKWMISYWICIYYHFKMLMCKNILYDGNFLLYRVGQNKRWSVHLLLHPTVTGEKQTRKPKISMLHLVLFSDYTFRWSFKYFLYFISAFGLIFYLVLLPDQDALSWGCKSVFWQQKQASFGLFHRFSCRNGNNLAPIWQAACNKEPKDPN